MSEGKHIHEHVELQVDSDSLTVGDNSSAQEKLDALLQALMDEDVEIDVETYSEEVK